MRSIFGMLKNESLVEQFAFTLKDGFQPGNRQSDGGEDIVDYCFSWPIIIFFICPLITHETVK